MTGRVSRRFQQGTDGIHEGASIGTQFNDAFFDHLLEESFAAREELDEHFAPVFAAWGAFDVGVGFHAIDEFNGAVVTERKTIGESPDGGLLSKGKASNGEEEKILLGLETRVAGGGVADDEEGGHFARLRDWRGGWGGASCWVENDTSSHNCPRDGGCEQPTNQRFAEHERPSF